MTKTENLNLNLIEPSDPVSPEPLNANMAALDAVVASNKSETDAALAEKYSPSNKPYVVGTYTGNGGARTIFLDFRPKLVMISGQGRGDNNKVENYFVLSAGGNSQKSLIIHDDSFHVSNSSAPYLCSADRTYDYIAFR